MLLNYYHTHITPNRHTILIENHSKKLINTVSQIVYTDVSETGKSTFVAGAKSTKIQHFRSKFQNYTEIVLVDEFHRNRCQNEGLGLHFQEKIRN